MAHADAVDETAIQERWRHARLFEAEPLFGASGEPRPKFFVNFPYPYMNGYLHMGHCFTLLRAEVAARYKRLRGYNVLWPFAFHCTGTPMVAAAQRVAEGEPKQLEILRQMGIPESELPRFADIEHWTRYFPAEAREDLRRLGVAVDWRRSFITTELNPRYDAFVRWQFTRLQEAGYLRQGSFPVVWDPVQRTPVGDHDRIEGEGETPQEFTLMKFPLEDEPDTLLVAATLRPETAFGQTNLWVDPELSYLRARVDQEVWVISRECAQKLALQDHEVETLGEIAGMELLGRKGIAPIVERPIPVLPAPFCDPDKGTGIVTSVPSDAPDDWMGLVDLREPWALEPRWGLTEAAIAAIEPIAIIDSGELGTLPAVTVCQELGVTSATQRESLEAAKHKVYLHGFEQGVMLDSCEGVGGLPVAEARLKVKARMLEEGRGALLYELTGKVVSRWLNPCAVKIVADQWFLAYGDEAWTDMTRQALADMALYPDKVRAQFDHVLGWLRDWACTREMGLGTSLPMDEKWLIESLSDSTIYMAYYTLARHLEHDRTVPVAALTVDFFDHVLAGRGETGVVASTLGLDPGLLSELRTQFQYFYPYDLRVSGKDLIQNHLAFSLYNHAALFPPEHWPRAFGLNGWILVEGKKMSKSAGNFYTLRQLLERYGADVVRATLTNAGEGLDDPNWDPDFADTIGGKLAAWRTFCKENWNEGRDADHSVDAWFASQLHRARKEIIEAYDRMLYKSAFKLAFFEMPRHFRYYLRRCDGAPGRELVNQYIETVTLSICPVVPHTAEDIYQGMYGGQGFASAARLPEPDESLIDPRVEATESFLTGVIDDVRKITKVTRQRPDTIHLYTAPAWKRQVLELALGLIEKDRLDIGNLTKAAMAESGLRAMGKLTASFCKNLALELRKASESDIRQLVTVADEAAVLTGAIQYLTQVLEAPVKVHSADTPDIVDPLGKAQAAVPGRPAIWLEMANHND